MQFLSSQQAIEKPSDTKTLDDIFKNIVGVVPDIGKTLEEYREERIRVSHKQKEKSDEEKYFAYQ